MQKIDLKEFNMDINIHAMYDYTLSSIYYEDSFTNLSDEIIFYTDCYNMKFNDFDFNKLTKNDLLTLLGDCDYTLKNKKDDIINAYLEYFDINDVLNFDNNILKKLGYYLTSSTGYNQGDYVNILIDVNQYKKIVGGDFIVEDDQKNINHLLWDVPVSLNFELKFNQKIDDNFDKTYIYNSINEDIFCNEYFEDTYDIKTLNKDKLIKDIINDLQLNNLQLKALKNAFNLDYEDIRQ